MEMVWVGEREDVDALGWWTQPTKGRKPSGLQIPQHGVWNVSFMLRIDSSNSIKVQLE